MLIEIHIMKKLARWSALVLLAGATMSNTGCSRKSGESAGKNAESHTVTKAGNNATNGEMAWQDWNTAYKQAVKEKKYMLVDVYTDWCGWCKRMDRDTYSKPSVQSAIQKKCVPVKFNPEIENMSYTYQQNNLSGKDLLLTFTRPDEIGFPMTVIYDPVNNKRIWTGMGYMDENRFLNEINSRVNN